MLKNAFRVALGLMPLFQVNAQILQLSQMNTEQIRALEPARTVVVLTGGMLEEHGPHLPAFTDGYSNEWLARRLAEVIVEETGLTVLMFPTIPLGHEGGNEIGGRHVFPGTYSVRRTTLRAIFMDLATEFGEQGFRRIFVVHGHGAPFHNLMLDQAGEYFRDSYGGYMVHLRGLAPTREQVARLNLPAPPQIELSDDERQEIGAMDEHAGFDETSRLLFLRPDLVSSDYRTLPALTADSQTEFFGIARADDWPGYVSSPRLATAQHGARLQQYRSRRDNALAIAILQEEIDEREIPRVGQQITHNALMMKELTKSTVNERARERRQREWLREKEYD